MTKSLFLALANVKPGCWKWLGYVGNNGYGKYCTKRNRTFLAHRIGYQLFRGEIPRGFVLDHKCRVRDCVNPSHLEVVTAGENVLRGEGITAVNKRKTVCKHGHPLTAENVFIVKRGRHCKACTNERKAKYRKRNYALGLPPDVGIKYEH